MTIYLKSGGKLREQLNPDVDEYTRRVDVNGNPTLKEILESLNIPMGLVAFAFIDGHYKRLDYRPQDGQIIILQPPVSGG